MDKASLSAMLDDCQLTEAELAMNSESWNQNFSDSFPDWDLAQAAS